MSQEMDSTVADFLARVKQLDERRNTEDNIRHRQLERDIDFLNKNSCNKSPSRTTASNNFANNFSNSTASYFQQQEQRSFGSSLDLNSSDDRYNNLKSKSINYGSLHDDVKQFKKSPPKISQKPAYLSPKSYNQISPSTADKINNIFGQSAQNPILKRSSIISNTSTPSKPPKSSHLIEKSIIKPFDMDDVPREKQSIKSTSTLPKKKPKAKVNLVNMELVAPIENNALSRKTITNIDSRSRSCSPKKVSKSSVSSDNIDEIQLINPIEKLKKSRSSSPSKVKQSVPPADTIQLINPIGREIDTKSIKTKAKTKPAKPAKPTKPKSNPLEIQEDDFHKSVSKLVGNSKAARLLNSSTQSTPTTPKYRSFGDMAKEMEIYETPSPNKTPSPVKSNLKKATDKKKANWFESALHNSTTPTQNTNYLPKPNYYNAVSASNAAKAPPLKSEIHTSLYSAPLYQSPKSSTISPTKSTRKVSDDSPTKHKASWLDSAIRNTPHKDLEIIETIKIKPSKPSKKSTLALKMQELTKNADDEYSTLKKTLKTAKRNELDTVAKREAYDFAQVNLKKSQIQQSKVEQKEDIERQEAIEKLNKLKIAKPIPKPQQETYEALKHLNNLQSSNSPNFKQKKIVEQEDPEALQKLSKLAKSKPIVKPPKPTLEVLAKLGQLNKAIAISKLEKEVPEAVMRIGELKRAPVTKRLDGDVPEAVRQLQRLKLGRSSPLPSRSPASKDNKDDDDDENGNDGLTETFGKQLSRAISAPNQPVKLPFSPSIIRKATTFDSSDLHPIESEKLVHMTKTRARGPKRRLPKSITTEKKQPPIIKSSSRRVSGTIGSL